jgi:hypothetical protein
MKTRWLLLAVLLLWCGGARCADSENAAEEQRNQIIERGRALIRDGRYREARQELGSSQWIVEEELYRSIDDAERGKRNVRALQLYKVQFAFFPLGWQGDANIENARGKWEERVLDYARLLSASPLVSDRRLAREERSAAPLFRAFIKARDRKTARVAWTLAQQLVERFPRSLFTLAAADGCSGFVWWSREITEGTDAALHLFQATLAAQEKAGAPTRHRIIVLQHIALEADDVMRPSAMKAHIGYQALRQIERLSDLPSEKSEALLKAAKAAMGFNEEDATAHSRTLYYEVLNKYPDTEAASQARRAIVETWLNVHQSAPALHAIQQFEPSAPPSEIAGLMLLVAVRQDGGYGDPDALPILEEIIKRFPRQGAAAQANVWLAAIYKKQGDEVKMLSLYEKVAALEKQDIDGGEIYMLEAQSTAIARLGSYYMQREQWKDALRWWRAYYSASWCGTGQEAANSANVERIALCLSKLGREDEALETLEAWTFKPHIETAPGVVVTLVEMYRKRGELNVLEAKLNAAPVKEKSLHAAGMALAYVDLIHAAERKDAAALWKPFDHKSHSTLESLGWLEKYGAKFLIEAGESAKPFLIAKAKSASPDARDETQDASSWACLLLARMKADGVLPILQDKLKHIHSAQELKYRFLALAILGSNESYALLQRCARSENGTWSRIAHRVLELFPRGREIKFLDTPDALQQNGPGFDVSMEYWRVD